LLIKSKKIDKSSQQYPTYALHFFPRNKDVDNHNNQTLTTLTTTVITIKSRDTKKDKETGQLKEI